MRLTTQTKRIVKSATSQY
uniref:Uncharacterized protein n=1 Tax=Rhizophora mucronata TaxID=61149 RepID=A0A2P2P2S2_RHIMU